jgi:hypothetical protein
MSTNRLALRVYRALLTQARAVGARGSDTLTVRLPVEGSWGHGQTFHGRAGTCSDTTVRPCSRPSPLPCYCVKVQASPCALWNIQHQDASRLCTGEPLGSRVTTHTYVNVSSVLQSIASRCLITLDSLADTIRTRFRAAKESDSREAAGHIDQYDYLLNSTVRFTGEINDSRYSMMCVCMQQNRSTMHCELCGCCLSRRTCWTAPAKASQRGCAWKSRQSSCRRVRIKQTSA